jgi:DNA topoisomerase-3
LIPREIHQAFRTLVAPNKNFSDAVEARMEIDLRIGAAFTRFQTKLLKYKFQDMPKAISYGPCQFPTLGFIIERERVIENFVVEPYWNINCSITVQSPNPSEDDENGNFSTLRF